MSFDINNPCPCGSKKSYKECCMVFHKGKNPKDPLTLMKSRYSAFAVGDVDYIVNTSTFQKDKEDLKAFCSTCNFVQLEILEHKENTVTFKAHLNCHGSDESFCEKSYFIKENGKWYYQSGEFI